MVLARYFFSLTFDPSETWIQVALSVAQMAACFRPSFLRLQRYSPQDMVVVVVVAAYSCTQQAMEQEVPFWAVSTTHAAQLRRAGEGKKAPPTQKASAPSSPPPPFCPPFPDRSRSLGTDFAFCRVRRHTPLALVCKKTAGGMRKSLPLSFVRSSYY